MPFVTLLCFGFYIDDSSIDRHLKSGENFGLGKILTKIDVYEGFGCQLMSMRHIGGFEIECTRAMVDFYKGMKKMRFKMEWLASDDGQLQANITPLGIDKKPWRNEEDGTDLGR